MTAIRSTVATVGDLTDPEKIGATPDDQFAKFASVPISPEADPINYGELEVIADFDGRAASSSVRIVGYLDLEEAVQPYARISFILPGNQVGNSVAVSTNDGSALTDPELPGVTVDGMTFDVTLSLTEPAPMYSPIVFAVGLEAYRFTNEGSVAIDADLYIDSISFDITPAPAVNPHYHVGGRHKKSSTASAGVGSGGPRAPRKSPKLRRRVIR